MYKQHPSLPPIDINQRIWHYYTLPKFLSLVSSSSLYLCRQDKFDDSFEGAMTKKDIAFFESKSAGMTSGMTGDSLGCTYSNCWTKADTDEYVLWNSYASLKDGVAVQSTVLRLISAFDPNDPRNVYVSNVLAAFIPDKDLRPDMTMDAIMSKENEIIEEKYSHINREDRRKAARNIAREKKRLSKMS